MNELESAIYIDLLELYTRDLETENLSLEIMNKAYEIADGMRKQMEPIQPAPQPALPVFPGPSTNPYQPWPNLPNYTWKVTSDTTEENLRDTSYSSKWDAFYYDDTKEWTEPRCSDPQCEFCKDRPNTYTGE